MFGGGVSPEAPGNRHDVFVDRLWQADHSQPVAVCCKECREVGGRGIGVVAADGVQPGDRVACYMPHVAETVITFLAANAIGATFTSTSSDFGTAGVVDRFGQTTPTVLVAADGYRYGGKEFNNIDRIAEIGAQLPSVQRIVVVDGGRVVMDGPRDQVLAALGYSKDQIAAFKTKGVI